jgi:hypothetical protein
MWPPNHKYQTIELSDFGLSVCNTCACISADDIVITKVTSDEAENGKDDGNTRDDIVIADDFRSVNLRSERSGISNGRVYTVHVAVSDAYGNIGTAALQVHVQLDYDTPVVDDGPAYEVLGADLTPVLAKANSDASQAEIASLNSTSIPTEFALKQNYPNPFNPTTTIEFAVPDMGFYTLKVYNTLGQEISELVNEQLDAGFYSLIFNASDLASGTYIYNLKGNQVNISKKLILLR